MFFSVIFSTITKKSSNTIQAKKKEQEQEQFKSNCSRRNTIKNKETTQVGDEVCVREREREREREIVETERKQQKAPQSKLCEQEEC